LENRRSEDDEMSREMWEAVETGAREVREVRVGKAEGRRSKGRGGKEEREEG